jgi:hypothetical protein
MRLEYICDLELAYREEPTYEGKFLLVRPYGGEEGTGYGEGDGTLTGPKLQGKAHWVNHPHRRSDGAMLPDVHGVILTDDGAQILFTLQGRTFFEDDTGKQLLHTTFEAEDERYRWLNRSVCVLEGVIDAQTLSMRARIYACVHELVKCLARDDVHLQLRTRIDTVGASRMTFVGTHTVCQAFGHARFYILVAETRGDAQPCCDTHERWFRRRCSQRMFRCGCAHQNQLPNIRQCATTILR